MSDQIFWGSADRFGDRRSPISAFGDQTPAARRELLSRLGVWLVIPMYRVSDKIGDVLAKVPDWVAGVVAVDDQCPERSGDRAEAWRGAPCPIVVVRHEINQGVGGAVLTGYRAAIKGGARIIVKVDGDDQMDLRWLAPLVLPIAAGQADYVKGNRFSSVSHIRQMPGVRVFGNSALSLLSKISSGYWNIFDPTNGYTAIDARVAEEILARDVAKRYFFESDMLYHLGALRAVVSDVAMPAIYGDEKSNLSAWRVVAPFVVYHARNAVKRFIGHYVVRNFSIATVETLSGVALIFFGVSVALSHFASRAGETDVASPGLVMLSALPIMLGVQFLLAAANFDVLNVPKDPIHPQLRTLDAMRFVAPSSGLPRSPANEESATAPARPGFEEESLATDRSTRLQSKGQSA